MINLVHADCREFLNGPLVKDQPLNISDHSIDLFITDPPYGVIKDKNVAIKGTLSGHKVEKNDCGWDDIDLVPFTKEWWAKVVPKMKDNAFAFIFWSQKYLKIGFDIFDPHRLIFWRYNNFTLGGNGTFAYDYDPIFVVKFGNPKLIKGKHSCDLEFTKPQSNFKKDKLIHPTQKPLALIQHLISIASKPSDMVLDCFGGVGTTAVAAQCLRRNAIVIENNKDYHEKAVIRLNSCVSNADVF